MATCINCRSMDHAAERREDESIVRCLDQRNREGVWFALVTAGTRACKHFSPIEEAPSRDA